MNQSFSPLAALTALALLSAAPALAQKPTGPVDPALLSLAPGKSPATAARGASAQIADPNLQPLDLVVRDGKVLIDTFATSADGDQLLRELQNLGLTGGSVHGHCCSGWLPLSSIGALDKLSSLRIARASLRTVNAGLVTSQGDIAQGSGAARATHGVDGTGVTVGVLSDAYDNSFFTPATTAADDVANGDLPPGVIVLDDSAGGIDEGRAMMQIVHDVAPGATLAFHTASNGQADFANGILELATDAGADVLVDDIIYLGEPMFQDGIIAQAIDAAAREGVTCLSSAGNQGRASYESPFVTGNLLEPFAFPYFFTPFFGGNPHDFGGGDYFQKLTVPAAPPGGSVSVTVVLQWDEPFASASPESPGSANDYDIYLFADDPAFPLAVIVGGASDNTDNDPIEIAGFNWTGPDPLGISVMIVHYTGPEAGRLKYVQFDSVPVSIDEHATHSSTLFGHANSESAAAVAAAYFAETPAFGQDPALVESFSAAGGTPILFDVDGTRRDKPKVRKQPLFTAPDGVSTTFFPPFPGNFDADGDSFPDFFGTSASAPHAAGLAALVIEAGASKGKKSKPLKPRKVLDALKKTAIDMDDPFTPGFDEKFDHATGEGLLDADAAIRRVSKKKRKGSKGKGSKGKG